MFMDACQHCHDSGVYKAFTVSVKLNILIYISLQTGIISITISKMMEITSA